MNSEKANKEDALKKCVKVEADRDAAVKAYVPPTHAHQFTWHVHVCVTVQNAILGQSVCRRE
jgi:ribosomal protein S12